MTFVKYEDVVYDVSLAKEQLTDLIINGVDMDALIDHNFEPVEIADRFEYSIPDILHAVSEADYDDVAGVLVESIVDDLLFEQNISEVGDEVEVDFLGTFIVCNEDGSTEPPEEEEEEKEKEIKIHFKSELQPMQEQAIRVMISALIPDAEICPIAEVTVERKTEEGGE